MMPNRSAKKPSNPKNGSQILPSAALEKLAEIAMWPDQAIARWR
jgi:hypothetical protein